jgi:sulfur carrier protein ThiS
MQITVKLFGGYRVGRFREAVRDYPDGSSVATVLQSMNIASAQGILLVNGKPALWVQQLSEGDTLALFPLVSGG